MPFAIPAAIVAVVQFGTAIAAGAAFGAAFTAALTTLAVNLVVGALIYALSPKPKLGLGQIGARIPQDRLVTVRAADEPHRIILGTQDVGGVLRYLEVSGSKKEFMHLVIVLAGHQVYEIGDIWLDNELVGKLDGAGNVTTGKFAGLVRIKKHLGSAAQVADSDLVAESASIWTSAHTGKGLAHVYMRLKRDDAKFPSGIPRFRARVNGLECYDPRTGTTKFTRNPILQTRELLAQDWFMNVGSLRLTDSYFTAQANVCEERVAVSSFASPPFGVDVTNNELILVSEDNRIETGDKVQVTLVSGTLPTPLLEATDYFVIRLDALRARLAATYDNSIMSVPITVTSSGTGSRVFQHIDQARYHGDMTFTLDTEPPQVFEGLATAYAGTPPVFNGNDYKPHAGFFTSPIASFVEDDVRGPISGIVRQGRRDLFNAVKALYVDAARDYQVSQAPTYVGSGYVEQDGNELLTAEIEYPATTNVIRAQRLAKNAVERVRQGGMYTTPLKLPAFPIEVWDIVDLTVDRLNWVAKTFRVVDWLFDWSPDSGIGLQLNLREENSAVFGWSAAAAHIPEVPLPLVLVEPTNPPEPPSGLSLSSGTAELLVAGDGTVISRIKASWTEANDSDVINYEVQWKVQTDTDYSIMIVPADQLSAFIAPVKDGVVYDVRVRSISRNAKSEFITDTELVAGKSASPNTPTSLLAVGVVEAIRLTWQNAGDVDIASTEIWEHDSDDRANSTKVAVSFTDFFTRTGLAPAIVRYYWIRHVDTSGNVSAFNALTGTSALTKTVVGARSHGQVAMAYGEPFGFVGLVPYNGNNLIINDVPEVVPTSGIEIEPNSLQWTANEILSLEHTGPTSSNLLTLWMNGPHGIPLNEALFGTFVWVDGLTLTNTFFNGVWVCTSASSATAIVIGTPSHAAVGSTAVIDGYLNQPTRVYAYMDGSEMKCELSLEPHKYDRASGVTTQSGNPSRTLVGMSVVNGRDVGSKQLLGMYGFFNRNISPIQASDVAVNKLVSAVNSMAFVDSTIYGQGAAFLLTFGKFESQGDYGLFNYHLQLDVASMTTGLSAKARLGIYSKNFISSTGAEFLFTTPDEKSMMFDDTRNSLTFDFGIIPMRPLVWKTGAGNLWVGYTLRGYFL